MNPRDVLRQLEQMPEPLRLHVLETLIVELIESNIDIAVLLRELISRLDSDAQRKTIRGIDRFLNSERFAITAAAPTHGDTPQSSDVLIVTVKPTELDACLRAFDVPRGDAGRVLGTSGIVVWDVQVGTVSASIVMIGAAGNSETVAFLSSAAHYLNFRAAVLVGMCAGRRGAVKLGTVIAADSVHAYEFQVLTANGAKFETRSRKPSARHLRGTGALQSRFDSFWPDVRDAIMEFHPEFPDEETERLEGWQPVLKQSGILTGGFLIEDGSLPDLIEKHSARVVGAEMEGAGFAIACEEMELPWLIFRGVADYGEADRKKHWQWPATFMTASTVKELLRERLILGLSSSD